MDVVCCRNWNKLTGRQPGRGGSCQMLNAADSMVRRRGGSTVTTVSVQVKALYDRDGRMAEYICVVWYG